VALRGKTQQSANNGTKIDMFMFAGRDNLRKTIVKHRIILKFNKNTISSILSSS